MAQANKESTSKCDLRKNKKFIPSTKGWWEGQSEVRGGRGENGEPRLGKRGCENTGESTGESRQYKEPKRPQWTKCIGPRCPYLLAPALPRYTPLWQTWG